MKEIIKKLLREGLDDTLIGEEITGYHRSPYNFHKFTTSKMGSGSGRQINGWGLYFTDSKPPKEYGDYLYQVTLFKGKDLGQYTLINLNKPVEKVIVYKIIEAVYLYYNKDFDIDKFNLYYDYIKYNDEHNNSLPKIDFNDYELIKFDYSGYLFYKTLSRILGGDKNASLFLLKNGVDGLIKSLGSGKSDYIIFDENDVTIEKMEYSTNI